MFEEFDMEESNLKILLKNKPTPHNQLMEQLRRSTDIEVEYVCEHGHPLNECEENLKYINRKKKLPK